MIPSTTLDIAHRILENVTSEKDKVMLLEKITAKLIHNLSKPNSSHTKLLWEMYRFCSKAKPSKRFRNHRLSQIKQLIPKHIKTPDAYKSPPPICSFIDDYTSHPDLETLLRPPSPIDDEEHARQIMQRRIIIKETSNIPSNFFNLKFPNPLPLMSITFPEFTTWPKFMDV